MCWIVWKPGQWIRERRHNCQVMELFERKRSAMVEKRLGPARKTCNEEVKKCWDWDLTNKSWQQLGYIYIYIYMAHTLYTKWYCGWLRNPASPKGRLKPSKQWDVYICLPPFSTQDFAAPSTVRWDWDLTNNDWDLWHIKCISIVYQDYIFHHISYLWDLMGGSIHGGSPIAGWFISWKIPIEN